MVEKRNKTTNITVENNFLFYIENKTIKSTYIEGF